MGAEDFARAPTRETRVNVAMLDTSGPFDYPEHGRVRHATTEVQAR